MKNIKIKLQLKNDYCLSCLFGGCNDVSLPEECALLQDILTQGFNYKFAASES